MDNSESRMFDRMNNLEKAFIKLTEEIKTENRLKEQDNKAREEWRRQVTDILEKLPDIFLRIDRLEQDKKRSDRAEGLAWASGIGLAFKIAWDIIVSHLK